MKRVDLRGITQRMQNDAGGVREISNVLYTGQEGRDPFQMRQRNLEQLPIAGEGCPQLNVRNTPKGKSFR